MHMVMEVFLFKFICKYPGNGSSTILKAVSNVLIKNEKVKKSTYILVMKSQFLKRCSFNLTCAIINRYQQFTLQLLHIQVFLLVSFSV